MIAILTGTIIHKDSDRVVVDVGGVGYEVLMSVDGIARLSALNTVVSLYIHTHVREDALILFGFPEIQEKQMFLVLTSVSGIGPKVALGIISGMKVGVLCRAIVDKDVKQLTSLKGIGKKTAERLCVELKDKVSEFDIDSSGVSGVSVSTEELQGQNISDAVSALVNLGYHDSVVRKVLTKIKGIKGDEGFCQLSVEELIRECLKAMA